MLFFAYLPKVPMIRHNIFGIQFELEHFLALPRQVFSYGPDVRPL